MVKTSMAVKKSKKQTCDTDHPMTPKVMRNNAMSMNISHLFRSGFIVFPFRFNAITPKMI
jgi:hypothetical protein